LKFQLSNLVILFGSLIHSKKFKPTLTKKSFIIILLKRSKFH